MGEQTSWLPRFKLAATYGLPFVWAFILLVFLNLTSPLQSGPFSVLIAFVLIYLLITSTLFALSLGISKLSQLFGLRNRLAPRTLYYLVSVIALGPVFILALNTLGQLEIKEVILVILLLVIGCFYVLRRGRKEVL